MFIELQIVSLELCLCNLYLWIFFPCISKLCWNLINQKKVFFLLIFQISHDSLLRLFILITRLNKIEQDCHPKQQVPDGKVDKEAIGLSRVQQFSHLCVAHPYQISVNSIFKHIHTISINPIIWQFVPFIYHTF